MIVVNHEPPAGGAGVRLADTTLAVLVCKHLVVLSGGEAVLSHELPICGTVSTVRIQSVLHVLVQAERVRRLVQLAARASLLAVLP